MKIIILFCMTFVTVWSRPAYGDLPYDLKSYINGEEIVKTPENDDYELFDTPEYINRHKRHVKTDNLFKQDDRKGVAIIPRDYVENLNTLETKEDPYQTDLIFLNGKLSEETDDFLKENEKDESVFVPENVDDKLLDQTDELLEQKDKDDNLLTEENYDGELNTDESNSSEDADLTSTIYCDEYRNSRDVSNGELFVKFDCHASVKKRLYKTGEQQVKAIREIYDKLDNYISNLFDVGL